MNVIVGAGLAGLLAAHAWPNAIILETMPEPKVSHRALLRFRTDAAARLTGIDFRAVTVRKGIWSEGTFTQPNIRVANLYSQKVIGVCNERSIWDIAPAQRFIAPDSLYEQLVNAVYKRIEWGTEFTPTPVLTVSTAPLPVILKMHGIESSASFARSPITVRRWKLQRADVFQTIYFPDADTPLYRASITGDTLIAELTTDSEDVMPLLERAFGVCMQEATPLGTVEQKYGKITDIDPIERKRLLFELTHNHNVYSLGRFATWRNILLDDVVDDIAVIKRLLRSTNYDLRHHY